jgi:Thoeris protein ThsB, TIR-like domain
MAYRSGTYVAFHAAGTSNPTASDMRYYGTLKMWREHDGLDFNWTDSHEKVAAIRDSSSKLRLRTVLSGRLRNSKNMVLIVTQDTRLDTDWVPFEIGYAVDTCAIPIIAAYPDYTYIQAPAELSPLWPKALADRIWAKTARVIHVPFKLEPLKDAIGQFTHDSMPNTSLNYYTREAYASFGISIP